MYNLFFHLDLNITTHVNGGKIVYSLFCADVKDNIKTSFICNFSGFSQ